MNTSSVYVRVDVSTEQLDDWLDYLATVNQDKSQNQLIGYLTAKKEEACRREKFKYQIEPRSDELGGGYNLRLLEDGEEVGGGVFPLAAYAEFTSSESDRAVMAYNDAQEKADNWLGSR